MTKAIPILLALLIAGCATVPQTTGQAVYATYGLYVTVAQSTADALEANLITVEQAKQIQSTLAEVRPRIDTAMRLVRSGLDIPDNRIEALRAVQQILLQVQQHLRAVK